MKYQGLELGGQAWARTPLGAATRVAAEQALTSLVASLQEIPWEGRIVGVSGQKCFISAGKDLNLKIGDEFDLFRRGEAIVGEGGSVVGYDETRVGRLKLVSVQKAMSIGKVLDGNVAEKGMIIRLPETP